MGLRLHLHVLLLLREGVGVIHVGRHSSDRRRRCGVGVHGVGGRGLVIVKVGSAVDGWFGRMLLVLIQRQVLINGMLVGMVMMMRMRRERVGGDVRGKPVGCQGAGCEAQCQRSEQPDRKPVGGRRRRAEVWRRQMMMRMMRWRQPR